MTQISPNTWCERFQAKLMGGLEAAWAMIENTDDPVVLRKARAKASACGTMAATARKIVLMTGPRRPVTVSVAQPGPTSDAIDAPPAPMRGIDRLKGGRRGRL